MRIFQYLSMMHIDNRACIALSFARTQAPMICKVYRPFSPTDTKKQKVQCGLQTISPLSHLPCSYLGCLCLNRVCHCGSVGRVEVLHPVNTHKYQHQQHQRINLQDSCLQLSNFSTKILVTPFIAFMRVLASGRTCPRADFALVARRALLTCTLSSPLHASRANVPPPVLRCSGCLLSLFSAIPEEHRVRFMALSGCTAESSIPTDQFHFERPQRLKI